jgi:protein-disulfide isomerase
VVGAVAVIAGVAWTVTSRATDPEPASDAPADSARASDDRQELLLEERTKGDESAPITIYEVSDFQCPFCRQFWERTLPALERDYIETGKARFVFLNLPLSQIHPNAPSAHEFAMCAARQSRFWPVHDLLYQHQSVWSRLDDPAPFFHQLADSADLERDELLQCFEAGQVRGLIVAEAQMNWRAGVRSTPSFIIEGVLLEGAAEMDVWKPVLDSIYAVKTGG